MAVPTSLPTISWAGPLRHALHDQVLHQRRGVEIAAVEPRGDRFAVQLGAGDQRRGQFQARRDRVERVEQRFFVFLQVAVVGQRQAL